MLLPHPMSLLSALTDQRYGPHMPAHSASLWLPNWYRWTASYTGSHTLTVQKVLRPSACRPVSEMLQVKPLRRKWYYWRIVWTGSLNCCRTLLSGCSSAVLYWFHQIFWMILSRTQMLLLLSVRRSFLQSVRSAVLWSHSASGTSYKIWKKWISPLRN